MLGSGSQVETALVSTPVIHGEVPTVFSSVLGVAWRSVGVSIGHRDVRVARTLYVGAIKQSAREQDMGGAMVGDTHGSNTAAWEPKSDPSNRDMGRSWRGRYLIIPRLLFLLVRPHNCIILSLSTSARPWSNAD